MSFQFVFCYFIAFYLSKLSMLEEFWKIQEICYIMGVNFDLNHLSYFWFNFQKTNWKQTFGTPCITPYFVLFHISLFQLARGRASYAVLPQLAAVALCEKVQCQVNWPPITLPYFLKLLPFHYPRNVRDKDWCNKNFNKKKDFSYGVFSVEKITNRIFINS